MAMAHHEIEFTKDGDVHDQSQVSAAANALPAVSDLLVLCHGWNNDIQEARELYAELRGNIDRLLDIRNDPAAPGMLRGLQGRTFAAAELFWPSKRFAESDLIPGGGAATAVAAADAAATRVLDALKEDPDRLGQHKTTPARVAAVDHAKALLPKLEADPAARKEYVRLIRSLLDPHAADADDGTRDFFNADAEELFKSLKGEVMAPPPKLPGGATSVGNTGGAAALGDFFSGITSAARRMANFATYYEMKSRAGTVGVKGVSKVLRGFRQRNPSVKLHLVGHSFGGRVVTAAAHALDANTPAVTISLLQAAYSHNGLSGNFDGHGTSGFFRAILSEHRASGPIIITHTKNDTAVGIAYPLASRIAQQVAAQFGDENDPYGGMGRNGAQRTAEANGNATQLSAVGADYRFSPGKIYNLLADDVIRDHSDVRGLEVAYAVLAAAGAI